MPHEKKDKVHKERKKEKKDKKEKKEKKTRSPEHIPQYTPNDVIKFDYALSDIGQDPSYLHPNSNTFERVSFVGQVTDNHQPEADGNIAFGLGLGNDDVHPKVVSDTTGRLFYSHVSGMYHITVTGALVVDTNAMVTIAIYHEGIKSDLANFGKSDLYLAGGVVSNFSVQTILPIKAGKTISIKVTSDNGSKVLVLKTTKFCMMRI